MKGKKMKRRARIIIKLLITVSLLFVLALPAEARAAEEFESEFEEIVPEGFHGVADGDGVDSYIGPEAMIKTQNFLRSFANIISADS